jgi:hypothetical protein
MTLKDSPHLPVQQTLFSTATARKITFIFSQPYLEDLLLAVLTITENTGISGFNGIVPRGLSATHGSTAGIQAGSDVFSPIWNFVHANSKLSVVVSYDDSSFVVSNITVFSMLAMMSTTSLQSSPEGFAAAAQASNGHSLTT